MTHEIRLGVIGVGGMGGNHVRSIQETAGLKLTAVCDIVKETADRVAVKTGAKAFYNAEALYDSGMIDGVIIAVPHYSHTKLMIDAFAAGIHALTEKPIAVHKTDAEKMITAARLRPDLKFAAMFQMRTSPLFKKLKKLIASGEMGKIHRINWIITNWFRSQAYYDSGSWRATWKGEGGGVLLNQCPHQLDILQWLFGMPVRIRAFCGIGKYHHIEVDDDVTAYAEYADGATAVFIASTGEAPGTDRLEISGDRGRIVVENQKITWNRTEISVREFLQTSDSIFGAPEIWNVDVPIGNATGVARREVVANFGAAIRDNTPLIAPGEEGINSVELANAMLYSALNNATVELPLDGTAFEAMLKDLIENSTFQKKNKKKTADHDMAGSLR